MYANSTTRTIIETLVDFSVPISFKQVHETHRARLNPPQPEPRMTSFGRLCTTVVVVDAKRLASEVALDTARGGSRDLLSILVGVR